MDYGHAETDKKLRELEKRIEKEYEKAANEVYSKMQSYLAHYKENSNEMLAKFKAGEIPLSDYSEWLRKQTILSSKWMDMRDNLVDVYMNADEVAQRMINDFRYDTYALNYNYGTYEVEKGCRMNTSFALYDKDTVKRLVKDNPKLLPNPSKATSEKIRKGELKKWNKKQLQSVMTQGILQGESVQQISKRLAETISERNSYSHVRAARTMATSVSGAGRLDAYKRAESMGIKMGKTWLAAHDNHTRRSHRQYDGMTIPLKEEFAPNLMFPADPDGPPEEVYNCRCTMVADVMAVDGIDLTDLTGGNWADNFENYDEWKGNHKVATPQTVVKKEPKTFKEKIDAIKNDPSLSKEEKVMKAGKVMQDDYNKNYLKPLQDEYEAAKTAYEKAESEMKASKGKIDALAADIDAMLGGKLDPSKRGFATIDDAFEALETMQERLMAQDALQRYNNAKRALGTNNYEAHVKAMTDRISQVRPVGGLDMKAHLNNSRSPMRKHVEYAYNNYPTAWCTKSIARGNLTPKKVDRGYYADWKGEIAISGYSERDSKRCSFHELGHRFERAVPEIRNQEKIFYERRTQGESLQWLGKGYGREEKTRFDNFVEPYMGKDYGGQAYELVSMGFEYAYMNPDKLAKDPDMQQWIFGILLTL